MKLGILRSGQAIDVTASLGAVSRPMKLSTQRAYLGLQIGEAKDDEGAPIERVIPGSPAAGVPGRLTGS